MSTVTHGTTGTHVSTVRCAFQLTFYRTAGSSREPCAQWCRRPAPSREAPSVPLSWSPLRRPSSCPHTTPMTHSSSILMTCLSPSPSAQASFLTWCPHLLSIAPVLLGAQSVCRTHQSGGRGSGSHTQRHRPRCKRWDPGHRPEAGPSLAATHRAPPSFSRAIITK